MPPVTPSWEGAGAASGLGVGGRVDPEAGRGRATRQHSVLTSHLRKLRLRVIPQQKPVPSLFSDSRLGVSFLFLVHQRHEQSQKGREGV